MVQFLKSKRTCLYSAWLPVFLFCSQLFLFVPTIRLWGPFKKYTNVYLFFNCRWFLWPPTMGGSGSWPKVIFLLPLPLSSSSSRVLTHDFYGYCILALINATFTIRSWHFKNVVPISSLKSYMVLCVIRLLSCHDKFLKAQFLFMDNERTRRLIMLSFSLSSMHLLS